MDSKIKRSERKIYLNGKEIVFASKSKKISSGKVKKILKAKIKPKRSTVRIKIYSFDRNND